jgi:CheY-like chemotaxis protein
MKQILLVEDNLGDARLAQGLLNECADFVAHVTNVGRVSDARSVLSKQAIDLIFLDLGLPDSKGLEGLRRLTSMMLNTPIIVLTGSDDKTLALEALKHGAQDYLVKGTMNAEALSRTMEYSIERKAAEVRHHAIAAKKSRLPSVWKSQDAR